MLKNFLVRYSLLLLSCVVLAEQTKHIPKKKLPAIVTLDGGHSSAHNNQELLSKLLFPVALAKLGYDAFINPRGKYFPATSTCKEWNGLQFAQHLHEKNIIECFEGYYAYAGVPQDTQHEILQEYQAYQCPGYWEFAENLPCYEQFILNLDTRLSGQDVIERSCSWLKGDCRIGVASVAHGQAQQIKRNHEHERNRNAASRAQEKCHQQLNNILQIPIPEFVPHTYQEKRKHALAELAHAEVRCTKKYEVTRDAQKVMQKYSYDVTVLQQFDGHQLQHVIHEEFIDIVTLTAERGTPHENMLMQFVDAGLTANIKNECAVAIKVANFCWGIVHAAGEGAVLGLERSANMFLHPVETAGGIVDTAQVLGAIFHELLQDLSVYANYALERNLAAHLEVARFGLPLSDLQGRIEILEALQDNLKNSHELKNYCCDIYEQRKQQATMLAEALREHCSHVEARDVVRESVACIVDAKVAGKLLKAVSTVLKSSSKHCAGQIARIQRNERPLTAIIGAHELPVTIADNALHSNASKHLSSSIQTPHREIVLPKVATYEQARNQALDIIGKVDVHSGMPHVGALGVGEGKIVGRNWHGEKVQIRLDYDPIKGPHVNFHDYRLGKGANGIKMAIPFEGSIETVRGLLKHLNTEANLKTAKSIFEKNGNQKWLSIISQRLKEMSS